MTTMTGYIRRASFSELSAVHLSELLLSGKRLDDDDDRDKKTAPLPKAQIYQKFYSHAHQNLFTTYFICFFKPMPSSQVTRSGDDFFRAAQIARCFFSVLNKKKFIILTSV